MDHNGVVVNTSDFHSSNGRSFPGRREFNVLFNVDSEPSVKKTIGGERETEGLDLLFFYFGIL